MKYKEQGAEHSHAYGQTLRRRCSQKSAFPFGLRQEWCSILSKSLTVDTATVYGLFLLSRHFWQQRIAINITKIGSICNHPHALI